MCISSPNFTAVNTKEYQTVDYPVKSLSKILVSYNIDLVFVVLAVFSVAHEQSGHLTGFK